MRTEIRHIEVCTREIRHIGLDRCPAREIGRTLELRQLVLDTARRFNVF